MPNLKTRKANPIPTRRALLDGYTPSGPTPLTREELEKLNPRTVTYGEFYETYPWKTRPHFHVMHCNYILTDGALRTTPLSIFSNDDRREFLHRLEEKFSRDPQFAHVPATNTFNNVLRCLDRFLKTVRAEGWLNPEMTSIGTRVPKRAPEGEVLALFEAAAIPPQPSESHHYPDVAPKVLCGSYVYNYKSKTGRKIVKVDAVPLRAHLQGGGRGLSAASLCRRDYVILPTLPENLISERANWKTQ